MNYFSHFIVTALLAATFPTLSWAQDTASPFSENSNPVNILNAPVKSTLENDFLFITPFKKSNGKNSIPIQFSADTTTWNIDIAEFADVLENKKYMSIGSYSFPVLSEFNDLMNKEYTTDFHVSNSQVLKIPKSKVYEWIQKNMSEKINQKRQDVTIWKEGDKIMFDSVGQNGILLDENAMVESLNNLSRVENQIKMNVPMLEQTAQVHKKGEGLENLKVMELISTGTSDFAGSSYNRRHNIKMGLSKYEGIIIKQGETFSFIDQLGEVDAAHGFLPELVIKGPDTIPEYGGGLCQVSSTMFRAALFLGLPIKERRNHSYAVNYYKWPHGWGFDATIYTGVVDLKFTNDTPGDILVQPYMEGDRAYYKFYGIADHRFVAVSDPRVYDHRGAPPAVEIMTSELAPGVRKVKENSHAGFTASFSRNVIYPDGKKMDETFVSRYQARPAIYLVGGGVVPTPEELETL